MGPQFKLGTREDVAKEFYVKLPSHLSENLGPNIKAIMDALIEMLWIHKQELFELQEKLFGSEGK